MKLDSIFYDTNSTDMDGIKSDIATQLLNSKDAQVAAAAKRIFFETEPRSPPPAACEQAPSLLIQNFGTNIPADIQEAACTVAMMAPNHNNKNNSTMVVTSNDSASCTISNPVGTVFSTFTPATTETTLTSSEVTVQPQQLHNDQISNAISSTTQPTPPLPVKKLTTTEDRLKRR